MSEHLAADRHVGQGMRLMNLFLSIRSRDDRELAIQLMQRFVEKLAKRESEIRLGDTPSDEL